MRSDLRDRVRALGERMTAVSPVPVLRVSFGGPVTPEEIERERELDELDRLYGVVREVTTFGGGV